MQLIAGWAFDFLCTLEFSRYNNTQAEQEKTIKSACE